MATPHANCQRWMWIELIGFDNEEADYRVQTFLDNAGFLPDAAPSIPRLLKRGISAGLIGPSARMLWTVGDDGWIFEARITNSEQSEYHGYPVRQTEAIAEKVYQRFVAWAAAHGGAADQQAATLCQQLYGFRT